MKRYRLVLASGGEVAAFDLVCQDDAEALEACQDRMAACSWAEAWDGDQLVCRWEHAPSAAEPVLGCIAFIPAVRRGSPG